MASNQRTARKPSSAGTSKKSPARPSATRPAKAAARKSPAKTARKPAPAPARPAAKATKATKPAKAARPVAKPAAKPTLKPATKPATKAAKAVPAPRPETATKPPARKAGGPAPSAATPRRTPRPGAEPVSTGLIHGIAPYRPTSGETYMNERQLEHFRQVLLAWKRELMEEVDRTVHHMQDEASNFPDPNDRATQESEFGLELRTRDRERKLLKKIDSALERIDDGSYGFCEETGEEIGLKRLEARPVATLSLEAQERRELAEKQYGERDDRFR
jgi:DnaK suppressor protein